MANVYGTPDEAATRVCVTSTGSPTDSLRNCRAPSSRPSRTVVSAGIEPLPEHRIKLHTGAPVAGALSSVETT